eukprot:gene43837-53605_t
MSAREAAQRLVVRARQEKVRLPSIWDESAVLQQCGTTLLLHRNAGGFDEEAALQDLVRKYGQEREAQPVADNVTAGKDKDEEDSDEEPVEAEGEKKTKKRKASGGGGEQKEKVKKSEVIAVEANRPIAEAVLEMAKIYFQNKDVRKGGVFSKAAKALRECSFEVNDKKA